MIKIYFAGSITGGREDSAIYAQLIKHLKNYGIVLTEHIADPTLSARGEYHLTEKEVHDRDLAWLEDSQILVAEVTKASLGVGYEIGRIVERNLFAPSEKKKTIVCLYRPQIDRRLSAMIKGCEGVITIEYSEMEQAFRAIDRVFGERASTASSTLNPSSKLSVSFKNPSF